MKNPRLFFDARLPDVRRALEAPRPAPAGGPQIINADGPRRLPLVTVDPQVGGHGVAVWTPTGRLGGAGFIAGGVLGRAHGEFVRNVGQSGVFAEGFVLAIERPESRGGNTKAPVDDLIALALAAGTAALAWPFPTDLRALMFVRPGAWNGGAPKEVSVRRCDAAFSGTAEGAMPVHAGELAAWEGVKVGPGAVHVQDAVAFGMACLGRIAAPD